MGRFFKRVGFLACTALVPLASSMVPKKIRVIVLEVGNNCVRRGLVWDKPLRDIILFDVDHTKLVIISLIHKKCNESQR